MATSSILRYSILILALVGVLALGVNSSVLHRKKQPPQQMLQLQERIVITIVLLLEEVDVHDIVKPTTTAALLLVILLFSGRMGDGEWTIPVFPLAVRL